ncbi:MAG: DUF1573 domain-containing protein, partial [Armatimonadetes bacterium]|nr:DUF1573 domain-containing protein [Armatimonadota bacterium]
MLHAIALLIQSSAPLGPEIPAGTHEAFLRTCIKIERNLSAAKFSEAAKLVSRLPKRQVVISYEDTAVPAGDRKQYRDAVTRATSNWAKALAGLKFTFASKGDIKISYSKTDLAVNPETGLPAGAAFFVSDASSDPRVEAVFALFRGNDRIPSNRRDIYNEAAFAIGTYLGVASSPAWGEVMHRTDSPSGIETRVVGAGLALARQCLGIADELSAATKNKKVLQPAIPELALEKLELNPQTTLQGDEAQTSFSLTNTGTTTLRYSLVPDCGCFTLKYSGTLKSAETGVVRVFINTDAFTGDFRKNLTLYSNDPEQPSKVIPVKFYIEPRYRFLIEKPKPVYIVGDSGLALPIYLARGKGSQFKVKSFEMSGTTVQAEMSEWQGKMPDLTVGNTTPQDWTVYKFSLLISPNIATGRAPITLTVLTDDP